VIIVQWTRILVFDFEWQLCGILATNNVLVIVMLCTRLAVLILLKCREYLCAYDSLATYGAI